jgi:hypothetical protein
VLVNTVCSGRTVVQSDNAPSPKRTMAGSATSASAASRGSVCRVACRGAWARITIDQFRHWALHTF